MPAPSFSFYEFQSLCNAGEGFCLDCNTVGEIDGYCEPDASERHCLECGGNNGVGMEDAMILEAIEVTG